MNAVADDVYVVHSTQFNSLKTNICSALHSIIMLVVPDACKQSRALVELL